MKPSPVISGKEFHEADRFGHLDNYILPSGRISSEVSPDIQEARLAYAKLRHIWHWCDIRLSIRGGVYTAVMLSVLLYCSEAWQLGSNSI